MLRAGDLSAGRSEQKQVESQKNLLVFGMANYVQDSGNRLFFGGGLIGFPKSCFLNAVENL